MYEENIKSKQIFQWTNYVEYAWIHERETNYSFLHNDIYLQNDK